MSAIKIPAEFLNKKIGRQIPRCYWIKGSRKKSPYVKIKCGDCDEKVKIYYGPDDDLIEVNGVIAPAEWWVKLFRYLRKFSR